MPHKSEKPILEAKSLAVASDGMRLLENLDIELYAGKACSLTGPSGCGKSTLLRTLAGLIDPSGGEILFHGEPPGAHGWPEYRRKVVFLDQQPVLLDGTVKTNLQRPFRYKTAGVPYPADAASELLEAAGIDPERLDQPARSLSVGQQQRVCLVRTLLVEPKVLLLDEPTSALDRESVSIVEEMLRDQVCARGRAALIVTHDPDQASRICDDACDVSGNVCQSSEGGAA